VRRLPHVNANGGGCTCIGGRTRFGQSVIDPMSQSSCSSGAAGRLQANRRPLKQVNTFGAILRLTLAGLVAAAIAAAFDRLPDGDVMAGAGTRATKPGTSSLSLRPCPLHGARAGSSKATSRTAVPRVVAESSGTSSLRG